MIGYFLDIKKVGITGLFSLFILCAGLAQAETLKALESGEQRITLNVENMT